MKEGDVALVPMPHSDGTTKTRPAVVLREMPPFRDMLVCGVSTMVHQAVTGFDEIVSPSDVDFTSSGLRAESLIRLGFLTVLPRRRIAGSIGAISSSRHRRLLQKLSDYLVRE